MTKLQILLFIFIVMPLSALQGQTITILYTNNNNGNISACDCGEKPKGGLARRKAVFDEFRKKTPSLLIVDAGDFLNGFGFNRTQDSLVILLYTMLGYDAVNVGEQEFANGFEFFYRRVRSSSLPLVSSNIFYRDTLLSKPYLIKSMGGVRIGITGYTPQESFRYLPNKHLLPVNTANSIERLKKTIEIMKSNCDILIVLSQAGYEQDLQLAKAVPEIDVIIGGHTQMEINEKITSGKTIITQAGSNGEWIGVLTLRLQNRSVQSFDNSLLPLELHIKEDISIQKIIADFNKK